MLSTKLFAGVLADVPEGLVLALAVAVAVTVTDEAPGGVELTPNPPPQPERLEIAASVPAASMSIVNSRIISRRRFPTVSRQTTPNGRRMASLVA